MRIYKRAWYGFYFFGEANAGGYYNRQEYDDLQQPQNNTLSKGYTVEVSLSPGIEYSVSIEFHLEAGFSKLAFIEFDHSRLVAAPGSGSSEGS